jgi:hypothetical protein
MGRQLRWDWATIALFTWCGLTLGLAVFGFLYPWSHTVFDIYARAGRDWWAGRDMYTGHDTAYYRYSPLFALSVSPLAALTESWGNALWRIVNCLLYAAGLYAWGRRSLAQPGGYARLSQFFLLVLPLSLPSMYNSQANLFMLGSVLLGLAAAMDGHWNWAAVWLALATLVKGYPLALALILAGIYPQRFALRYLAALAGGLLLPFATQHPATVWSQYASWWNHLRDSTFIMRERLRSLDHLFSIYGYSLSPRAFLMLQLIAGAIVFTLCRYSAARSEDVRRHLSLAFLGFATWVVLFGPATESCTYVVVAPAIAWALLDSRDRPRNMLVRSLLIVSLLLMGPFTTDMVGSALRNFANEHGSQPIGALLFLICQLIRFARPAASPSREELAPQEASLSAAA